MTIESKTHYEDSTRRIPGTPGTPTVDEQKVRQWMVQALPRRKSEPTYGPWRDERTISERRAALNAANEIDPRTDEHRTFQTLAEARALDPVIDHLTAFGEPVYPSFYECWLIKQENRECVLTEPKADVMFHNSKLLRSIAELRIKFAELQAERDRAVAVAKKALRRYV